MSLNVNTFDRTDTRVIITIIMMVIIMGDSKLNRMTQIKSFLPETVYVKYSKKCQKEDYSWIEETLMRFHTVD